MVQTSSYRTVLSVKTGLERQVTEPDASQNSPIRRLMACDQSYFQTAPTKHRKFGNQK